MNVSTWSSWGIWLTATMAFFILKIGNHIMTNGSYMMNNALCSNLVVVTSLRCWPSRLTKRRPTPSPAPAATSSHEKCSPTSSCSAGLTTNLRSSGKWPEKCMVVIDERGSASRSSINEKGHYRTDLMELPVEGKDWARNPDE